MATHWNLYQAFFWLSKNILIPSPSQKSSNHELIGPEQNQLYSVLGKLEKKKNNNSSVLIIYDPALTDFNIYVEQ